MFLQAVYLLSNGTVSSVSPNSSGVVVAVNVRVLCTWDHELHRHKRPAEAGGRSTSRLSIEKCSRPLPGYTDDSISYFSTDVLTQSGRFVSFLSLADGLDVRLVMH